MFPGGLDGIVHVSVRDWDSFCDFHPRRQISDTFGKKLMINDTFLLTCSHRTFFDTFFFKKTSNLSAIHVYLLCD